MEEELLTISAFAKMFGTTHHGIRHYEEKGLLLPAKIAENGYRQYGMSEAYELSFILFMRELGLSVKEIKDSMADNSEDSYSDLLKNKKSEIRDEILRLTQLEEKIDDQLVLTEEALQQDYIIKNPVYLTVIKTLELEEPMDLSVLTIFEQPSDFMMAKVYYIIREKSYDVCVETTEKTSMVLPEGTYSYQTLTAETTEEFEQKLEDVLTISALPIVIVEDNSRFLSVGKQLSLKVLELTYND